MSIFNKFFGNNNEDTGKSGDNFWKFISSEGDIEELVKASFHQKIAIFKHSTRCHISKMVLRNFEKEVERSDKDVSYYFLDLLLHRDLSNKIAEDFEVQHQSPQLIVIKDGKAIRNASHQNIDIDLL